MDDRIEKNKELVDKMEAYAENELTKITEMWKSKERQDNLISLWLKASELAHAYKTIYDAKKEMKAV